MTKLFKNFKDDESGGIMVFIMVMFSIMIVGGGMAVDYVNLEYQRESVQDAIDRGVLAAVAGGKAAQAITDEEILAAEEEAVSTVREYIITAGYTPEDYGVTIDPTFTLMSQRVDASMDYNVNTFFLRMIGIPSIGGRVQSAAEISVNNIEISLVVDISGSMQGDKIADLRTAATNFVRKMLAGDRATYTSISLIPFSGQVNAGESLAAELNYNRWHNYSSCVDFAASDFSSSAMSLSAPREQTQHFSPEWIYEANSDWCPRNDLAIVPLSNDLAKLETAISALRSTGMTAGNIGVKWGAALLDPSMRPAIDNLITDNKIDLEFSGRPAEYSDDETIKFIIFMTDGTNTNQYSVKSNKYDVYGYSVPPQSQLNADYWEDNRMPWSYTYLQIRVSGDEEDSRLDDVCTSTKDNGVVVFTIGYDIEVNGAAETVMKDCASSEGHYYPVETSNLDAAFDEIAQSIQKLRLVN